MIAVLDQCFASDVVGFRAGFGVNLSNRHGFLAQAKHTLSRNDDTQVVTHEPLVRLARSSDRAACTPVRLGRPLAARAFVPASAGRSDIEAQTTGCHTLMLIVVQRYPQVYRAQHLYTSTWAETQRPTSIRA